MGRHTDDLHHRPRLHAPKGTYARITLAADLTFDEDTPTILTVDPTADGRKVILPAITEPYKGLMFLLTNAADAAESILVRSPGDAATIGTIAQNENAWVYNDGTTWYCGVMAQT